jgi:hypothetical protein
MDILALRLDMRLFGLPITVFTFEDLIIALALSEHRLTREHELHAGTIEMLRGVAADRAKKGGGRQWPSE